MCEGGRWLSDGGAHDVIMMMPPAGRQPVVWGGGRLASARNPKKAEGEENAKGGKNQRHAVGPAAGVSIRGFGGGGGGYDHV